MKRTSVKRIVYALGVRSWHHIRCEADVLEATARWRMQAGKDMRCELGALFVVDGKHLCKRHAGDYLLSKFTDGEYVVERPARPDQPASAKGK